MSTLASPRPLSFQAYGLMVLICLIWALQQVILKATASEISPTLQIALRSGAGAVLVWLFMVSRGEKLVLSGGEWKPGLLVGLLFAIEFLLVGQGLNFTSASHMAVFLYTAPIFAALGLQLFVPAERLSVPQWIGIGLSFLGISIAFLGGEATHEISDAGPSMLWGDFMGVLAGFFWGATTVIVRTTGLSKLPATQTLLYQLAGAFLLLIPAGWWFNDLVFNPSVFGWASLVFQALVVSFASYLIWFWMLRHYLASRLSALSFMTPLFGVGLGVWLLHEPLTRHFLMGAALVILGIILVSGYESMRAIFRSKSL